MPASFFVMVAIMTLLVGGLVYVHYRSLRASPEKFSVAGAIGTMVLQYVVFGFLLFLFVNCAGCFNRVLIPY